MDGLGGLVGFQWLLLVYGLATTLVGFSLLWWLPNRPQVPGLASREGSWPSWLPLPPPALKGEYARIHFEQMSQVYHRPAWKAGDLLLVLMDWRIWPLAVMYFGVAGCGIGVQNYGTVILRVENPELTGVQLSLLFAPIWIVDVIAILLVTPLSDRFHRHRAALFSIAALLQITGLLITTFAVEKWARYGGLLIVGFGLGPTVPVAMTWTSEIFSGRHGEVGVAAASALVSGLGNLGSIVTTYALYKGWESDGHGPHKYRKSNLVMVGILAGSVSAALVNTVLLRVFDGRDRERTQSSDAIRSREDSE